MSFFTGRVRKEALLASATVGALLALSAAAHESVAAHEGAAAHESSAAHDKGAVHESAAAKHQQATTDGSGPQLRKVGEARLKVMLWSVYDSRLYTPSGDYRDGVRPLKLDIEYLINVKSEALVERTAKEWRSMGREHPRQAKWLKQLGDIWTDVSAGDVIGLKLDEQNSSTFYKNGQRLGQISDPEFGEQFVDIWLSKDTSRPEIRLGLLGRTQGD